jgi:hypothetical protein
MLAVRDLRARVSGKRARVFANAGKSPEWDMGWGRGNDELVREISSACMAQIDR